MGATSPERDQDEKPLELTVQLNGEPVRVGLTWQVDDAEPQAVIVIGVMPDSAAEHAGLKPAERIYQVDGKDFSSSAEFQSLLLTAPNPLDLAVEQQGQIHHVHLQRAETKH